MRYIKGILPLIIALFAVTGNAADWWSDFSISPYAQLNHPDLGKPTYGAGLDVGYFINHTVSLHLANTAHHEDPCERQWGGSVVDETSLITRADLVGNSKDRFVLYVLASGDRLWKQDEWGLGAGVGAEVRFTKNASIGADARIRAFFKDSQKDVPARLFLSLRF